MAILILGGKGNLGTQLAELFSGDYSVVAWDREDLDVLDFPSLAAKVRSLRPELIINAVAYNAVDQCEEAVNFALAVRLNGEFPGVLADLALEVGATLIHYSTDYVFSGTAEKREFREDDTPNPANKYGESKFQGEREVLRRAANGLNYYLIRTSKLFGPRGTSPQAKPSFFEIILGLARDKGELTVVNEELSCFTYTPDLALATKRLFELEAERGIYHLVNDGPATWYDGAIELLRVQKMDIPVRAVRSENLLRPARRPKFSVLKNTKTRALRPWPAALQEYLRMI